MRRTALVFLMFVFACLQIRSQLVNKEELEILKTNIFGTQTWKSIAQEIGSHLRPDNNGVITYQKVVEIPEKTKDELFSVARQWATKNFNGSDCDVRMVDKEAGCIIVQGYVNDVASNIGWANSYDVRIRPVLKIDVKNGKIRLTVTQSSYDVHREQSAGFFREHKIVDEHWEIRDCFPFVEVDLHEKTSAKALVMTHLCATVYIKSAEEALRYSAASDMSQDDW